MNLCRSLKSSVAAFVAATFLLQPSPALARTASDDLVVVAPDAAYLALERTRVRDVFAAVTATKVSHPLLDESHFVRPAARTFVAFPVIDPATGKAVPRTASIVLHAGPKKGQSVNAGEYWDQVNAIEKAAAAAGATLRDTKPEVTGALRFKAGAYSRGGAGGGTGKPATATLKSIGAAPALPPDTGYVPSGTPALGAQKAVLTATLNLPQPCLNAPSSNVRSIAKQIDMDALGGANVAPLFTPSPTPSPAPAAPNSQHSLVHAGVLPAMRLAPTPTPAPLRPLVATTFIKSTAALTLGADEIALEEQKCPNPLSPLPTAFGEADLATPFGADRTQGLDIAEIGDRGLAAVDFAGSVTVGAGKASVRKPSPTLTAVVTATAFLLDSESDFLSETASAGGEKPGAIDIEILGQSVASPSIPSGQNAGGTSNTYTILNLNVPIPIIAGIDVNLSANVSGTLGSKYSIDVDPKGVDDTISLEGLGNLSGTFNASMDVNAIIVDVSGGVSGNLQFASFDIPASGELALVMTDRTIGGSSDHNSRHIRDCQMHFSYVSAIGSSISALSGNVYVYARECIEYIVGSSCSEQDVTIANFGGTNISPSAGSPWKTAAIGPRYTDGPSYGIPLGANERFSPDEPTTAVPRACNSFPIQYAN